MYDLICSWQNSILLRNISSVTAFLECLSSSSKTAPAVLHNHPQKYCYLEAERLWIMVRNRALPPWEHSSRGSKMLKFRTAFSQRFNQQQNQALKAYKSQNEFNPPFTCSAATGVTSLCVIKSFFSFCLMQFWRIGIKRRGEVEDSEIHPPTKWIYYMESIKKHRLPS